MTRPKPRVRIEVWSRPGAFGYQAFTAIWSDQSGRERAQCFRADLGRAAQHWRDLGYRVQQVTKYR